MKNILHLFFVLSTLLVSGQTDSLLFEIKYEFQYHKIALSDSGLVFSNRIVEYKRFRTTRKNKCVFIVKNELNQDALYRLRIFLEINDYLKTTSSIIVDSSSPFETFVISNSNGVVLAKIIDNSSFQNSQFIYEQYLLNELRFLLNDLIPDKYKMLKIKVVAKPSPRDIRNSLQQ